MVWAFWAKSHHFTAKKCDVKCDTVTAVTLSHNKLLLLVHFLTSQATFFCDKCHTVILSHYQNICNTKKLANWYFEIVTMWPLSHCHISKYFLRSFFCWCQMSEMTYKCDKSHKINIAHFQSIKLDFKQFSILSRNVTLWQLSYCHILKLFILLPTFVTNVKGVKQYSFHIGKAFVTPETKQN